MLHEVPIRRLEHGSSAGSLVARCAEGAAASRTPRPVRLLLARDGALVGIDARDATGVGPVAMLGPHEDVASAREAYGAIVLATDGHLLAIEVDGAGLPPTGSPYLRGD